MTRSRCLALALLPALALSGCVATTVRTRTWTEPPADQGWELFGHVQSVRETIRQQQGDPAAGAVAGAIIGSMIGSALGGHWGHDAWGRPHRHGGGGALVGAIGGAMVGAASSQGESEERWYEVFVRFQDGRAQTYLYQGASPFQVGDQVRLTSAGLERW